MLSREVEFSPLIRARLETPSPLGYCCAVTLGWMPRKASQDKLRSTETELEHTGKEETKF